MMNPKMVLALLNIVKFYRHSNNFSLLVCLCKGLKAFYYAEFFYFLE